jgi:hypothetical protein
LAPKGAGLIKSEMVLAPKGATQNFIKISGMIILLQFTTKTLILKNKNVFFEFYGKAEPINTL